MTCLARILFAEEPPVPKLVSGKLPTNTLGPLRQ